MTSVVAKVGGSLFDLPDLRDRLIAWMDPLVGRTVYLVPGGGEMADAIRRLDATHGLGEESSHRLALRTMSITAAFLAELLALPIVNREQRRPDRFVVDADAWWSFDPLPLPHSWSVSSDSIAAVIAQRLGAELHLLKSTEASTESRWDEAADAGLVDAAFPEVMCRKSIDVLWVNLRR